MSAQESEIAVSPEAVEAAEVPSGSEESYDYWAEPPAELLAELEAPELEDPTEDEIDSLAQEYGEDYDGQNRELAARALAAEKKAAHFEKLRLQEARKNWEAEATKFFPGSQGLIKQINATSRRGFLKTAKDIHNAVAPVIQAEVEKRLAARQAPPVAVSEVESSREERSAAWGQTVVRDVEQPAAPASPMLEQRRRRGDLADSIRDMLKGGQ